jgi:YqaJ-like viral recombinase domain
MAEGASTMTIHRVEQGSDEWKALRVGKVTASRVADVIAKIKSGGYSASRANYLCELVLERLTGRSTEGFVSQDMIIGTLREPDARAEYELRMRCEVEQIGFVDHPTIPMTGASADGFVGADGLVEFKCPKPATHLETLKTGTIPGGYMTQILWNLACNPDRQWCDYCSFNPDFPESMVLFRKRVPRDNAVIAGLEKEVRVFLVEIDREIADLRGRFTDRRAA